MECTLETVATNIPIILAHGICPFDKAIIPFFLKDNNDQDRFHYFRKIRSTLITEGFQAFHSRVSWAADLEKRASDLREEIVRLTANFRKWSRVHIVAHSMGGLDARCMIHKYRMEKCVASLTTIGTPHLGTSYADWGIQKFGSLIGLAGFFGINIKGFKNLTRESCNLFNNEIKSFEKSNGVLYQTVAGVQPLERTFAPLKPSYRIIFKEEGPNDGLVSLKSAKWENEYFLEEVDADHLNQLGWWDPNEAGTGLDRETFEKGIREVYVRIAKGLED